MKFLLDVPRVQVRQVQVRVVLYPDIATVKLVFKLHCYTTQSLCHGCLVGMAQPKCCGEKKICSLKYPVI